MESEASSNSLEDGNGEQDSSFGKSYEKENSSPLDGNSGNPEDGKTQHDKQIENVCIFCQQNEDNEFKFGKLCRLEDTNNGRMITAHHYCLFFASGLCQEGSDNEGIQGFLANDIQKEVSRASRLKCSFCMKKGASVGCCIKKCRQCYHYPCGRENGSLFRFYNDFVSYCATHRPSQEFSTAEAMNLSLVKCPVCLDEVPNEPGFDVLKTPCCHNTFLHRDCIQQQALASGYYFFRCPICNNQKEFRDEMRLFGVHVPEQDAAWEREEGAFQELYQRHNRCDIEDCLCPKGKEHSTTQGKWQIVLCDFCGSFGCHMECGRLERPSQDWACSSCRGMLSTDTSNGLLFESTPCKKKGRARSAMKFKGKTPRAGIKNKKVKKSTGTIEVDVDTDSPSTSRDGISDDFETARKEKKKKRVKKIKKVDKKKSKSSQPPTLTRADLSPVRPVLSGDGPKTPKLSPIWDNFVTGKKHTGKGFKRHMFGKHSSSKSKGLSISLKTSQTQKQKNLKGAGKAGGGKKKSQKAINGALDSSSKLVGSSSVSKNKTEKTGKGSQATGKAKLPLSTTVGGDEGSQALEPGTFSGGKKVPKSQHAVIFQSQSKLFKSGCPMRVKQDLASAFMKRSLATVKGELVSNLPLVRLCKMALAEGDDLEQVQASGWKRALIRTTQEIPRKKEAGAEGSVRASRMSMRKRADKKIGLAPKKKSEQGVIRSTRSKVNSEQLTNDILQESAKNILHAVLTGSKPVDLESYLHHRSKNEEVITMENTRKKEDLENPSVLLEGNEEKNLSAAEDSTVDEIIICSLKKQKEKDGFVDMNESEVNDSETKKKQCLRSFSKSSDCEAYIGRQGTMEQKEEQSAKRMSETSVVSPTKLKDNMPKQKICSSDSASEKEKSEDSKSDTLGTHDNFIKIGQEMVDTKSSTKGGRDGPIKSASGENEPCENTLTVVGGSLPRRCSSKEDQTPVGGKVTRMSMSNSQKSLSIQVSGATRKTDKVQKKMAQESASVKALDKNVGSGVRSSPRLGSTSKLSPIQNVNESSTKGKQIEVQDGKSLPLPPSSEKVQKKTAQESVSVKVLDTNVGNEIRSSPRLGSTSKVSPIQNVNESSTKDKQIEVQDGKSSPLPLSSDKVQKKTAQESVSVKVLDTNVGNEIRSSPRLGSTSKVSPIQNVNESSTKDKQIEVQDGKSSPLPLSSDKVQKKTAQESVSVKVLDTNVGNEIRSSPRLGSTSKVPPIQNVNESSTKDKQIEMQDGKSSPLPLSSDKVQKKTAQESVSVKVRETNVGNEIRSSPRLGSTSKVSPIQHVNESSTKGKQVEIVDGRSSPLPHSFLRITRSSPQSKINGQEKTTGVSDNLSSHLTAGNVRSSPRLRSSELHDDIKKTATDTLLKHKDRNQKLAMNKEQEAASGNENADAVNHETGKPIRVSPVNGDKDQRSTDSQNDGQEDVSIIAVFTNKEKVKKPSQTKGQLATQSDQKGKDGCTPLKRKREQQSPIREGGMLQKVLQTNYTSYEDIYKQEKKDSSKSSSKKDSCDERVGGKLVRHSKGNATGHRKSSSEHSEDVAILGVFKTGPTQQKKVKIKVLSQVQTKEKRSTPSLRSEKRKRAKSDSRDGDQKSWIATSGDTKSKDAGESPTSSVKSSSPEASDTSKPKAKKTLNDYFQATDKKLQQSGNDVKRSVSSVVGNVTTTSVMVKTNPSLTKSNSSSASKANSPVVKINHCSLAKPVAKTDTAVAKVNSSVVKASPSLQTRPTEDVTIVGIFKKKNLSDSRKQCHVPNTSKDANHSQHRENMSKADLSNKKVQDIGCTKKVGQMPRISATWKTLSFTDRNISEHVSKSATEIMAQREVRIEPRQTPNRQRSSTGNTSQYVLSSDYVSCTPSPQERESNRFYRTSQYSWPLPKRELDMDVVILDVHKPSVRQIKSRSRLFSDSTEKNLQSSNEASLKFSSPSKQPSSDTCKEQETKTLAPTLEGNSLNAREILRKQPSKRKYSEMDGGDTSTAEPLPSPNKENTNLKTREQGKALKDNQEAGLSHKEGQMGKEDSVSKRRSKRLKKGESSSSCDVYDFTDDEDIFPQSESKDAQDGQLSEANMQHCPTTGKLHGKVSMEDVEKRQTTPQKRVLLQRPLSLCKVVDRDNEGEAARSTRRKCNSDLKVKKPLTVQKISRRQLVM